LQRSESDPFAAIKVNHLITGELVIFRRQRRRGCSIGIAVVGWRPVGLIFPLIAPIGFATSGEDMGMVGQAI
jgi:hypothetical protein